MLVSELGDTLQSLYNNFTEQLLETILSYYNNTETVDEHPETNLLGATVRKYIYLAYRSTTCVRSS